MDLERTAELAARIAVLPSAGSTNDELVARAGGADPWPHLSVVATDDQTAGRGRRGRVWSAPAGTSLAASVLLRPTLPADALGWVPLLTGLAVTRTLRRLGAEASLKWPNDVLIGERKVCGILAELLPGGGGVVVGVGINLTLTADELPVPTATSLALEGVSADADTVLAGVLGDLTGLLDALVAADGDPDRSGLRAAVMAACSTLGRAVTVELPSGELLRGTAAGLGADGRLEVRPDAASPGLDPKIVSVSAGDVTHLRY
ncbi:biotin--[acetyl-CoA-carboxylase] ligase [Naasia aerilata]|uniref:biotin--[biotin carboxyl-carrier protein] ligase n=1 Tax=Naasia aerilata TaxID=1162966 RepID=A0ABM8GCA1_9MICO|nr:biotin--[acetyl-CoA-carboxylase] ligase [Naasia aerilata]BDZ45878.1 biotin--[acetyl-CoA-carboxylase] ligase [Naasia aerilata]